jgi:SAM-dependent MidA family methyltransferase
MAAVLLEELAGRRALCSEYWILETSADLRERQRDRLAAQAPELLHRVRWLDRLPGSPWRGVLVANEVVDSLPVRRVCFRNGGITEQSVGWNGRRFGWTESLPGPELEAAVRRAVPCIDGLPDGYTTEINTELGPWIRGLASCLDRGAMLFIDYGHARHEYYHPQRRDGTLLCHYRHRVHADPFLHAGLQDITAAVDFSALAAAGAAAGLDLSGYTTQAHFLTGCGLPELLAAASPANERETVRLRSEARQLVLPGEMGEHVKVMALTRGIAGPLRGFVIADHRARLRRED